MKYLLIFIIKLYWRIIPEKRRKKCLFSKSCSNYVYEKTINEGFYEGIKALKYRYKVCRSNYIITELSNEINIILCDGSILCRDKINSNIELKNFH